MKISFTLNGRPVNEDVPADQTLFSYCREHALKSVKCGRIAAEPFFVVVKGFLFAFKFCRSDV